jgi:hypothetical protein
MKGNQRFKVTKSKRIPIMLSTHEAKNDEMVIRVLLAAPSCHAEASAEAGRGDCLLSLPVLVAVATVVGRRRFQYAKSK